jgi:chromosome partitioning protein
MAKDIHYRYGLPDIAYRAGRMAEVLNSVKEATLKPDSVKIPPRFSQALTGEFLGLGKARIAYLIEKGQFPTGQRVGNRTLYTIDEIRAFAVAQEGPYLRHPFAPGHGLVATVANFKGGVAKTSTTVTLAQYLSLRGYNVCVIDMDPQASATTLFGVSPHLDVDRTNGIDRLFDDDFDVELEWEKVARPTYWPGINLIAANPKFYSREFALAGYGARYGGEVFGILAEKLEPLRARFDVLLIDTQPSQSFLTSVSMYAAQHLIVTVPPSNLDFASCAVFWELLEDLMKEAQQVGAPPKFWEAIHVLMTRVDEQDKASHMIRKLLAMGCEDWLMPDVIPATRVATTAASEFSTVYDIEKYEGSARSIKRARELFDKAYFPILQALEHTWSVMQSPENYDIRMNPEQDLFDALSHEPMESAA